VSRLLTSFGLIMYRNKTTLCVVGPVVAAVVTSSNFSAIYVFWVNGSSLLGTNKIWGLFKLFGLYYVWILGGV
jgi:hypothetical protein